MLSCRHRESHRQINDRSESLFTPSRTVFKQAHCLSGRSYTVNMSTLESDPKGMLYILFWFSMKRTLGGIGAFSCLRKVKSPCFSLLFESCLQRTHKAGWLQVLHLPGIWPPSWFVTWVSRGHRKRELKWVVILWTARTCGEKWIKSLLLSFLILNNNLCPKWRSFG